jgi:hypothetical protein
VPIQGWAPGLYVLSIEAASRVNPDGAASRMIQFEVR